MTTVDLPRTAPLGRRENPVASFFNNKWSVGGLSILILLIIWQLFGTPYVTSTPSAILAAAAERFVPEVLPAFGETLKGLSVGFGIAVVAGIPLGLLMSYSRVVELALAPYVYALYATPRIVLIPILILWLGISFNMRVGIVVLSALFPILLNTYLGGREVSQGLLDVGRAFRARPMKIYTSILLRGSLPYVFTGIRLGLGRGLLGVVTAEIVTAAGGVGNQIVTYAKFFRIDAMFVVVVLLGILAMVLTAIIIRIQDRFLFPWQYSKKKALR